MNGPAVFPKSVLAALVAGATAIFALSVVLMLTLSPSQETVGPNTLSISAIGHAGLYELLQRAGVPVARSEIKGIAAPGMNDLLVVAEPPPFQTSHEDILRVSQASNLLLVLPERTGSPDQSRPEWVGRTGPLAGYEVKGVAELVLSDFDLARVDPPKGWHYSRLGIAPSFTDRVQLIRSSSLRPVVWSDEGTLVGTLTNGDHLIWVLSDPDLVENHGIVKGDNAAFVLALFDKIREGDSRVIFDETIHGVVSVVDNPFAKLFTFPYAIVLCLMLIALALLLWATIFRFGAPATPPPAIDFGKSQLIATTASLLDRAGRHGLIMRRYVEQELRETGYMLRAPRRLGDAELADWLDKIGAVRGIDIKASDIMARARISAGADTRKVMLTELFQAANDIHTWKKMISDGTRTPGASR